MTNLTELHGTNGSRDERGLISLVVPYLAETLDECFAALASPLAFLSETARTFTHDRGGKYIVEVTYEGSDISGTKKEEPTYECKTGYREETIEAHPQIQTLIKKYNGQTDPSTGKVTFPATLEGSSGTNALGAADGAAAEKPNPMAGVEKYMALEVTWSKKYIDKKPPSFASVGRLTTAPPGGAPSLPNRAAWLVMPPIYTKRGTVYEITEEWQLLPEGTPKDVYNLGGSGGKSPNNSDHGMVVGNEGGLGQSGGTDGNTGGLA